MVNAIIYRRWCIGILLACSALSPVQSQVLETAGTFFVFSIPEDASNLYASSPQSKLVINIMSASDGTGTLEAPNGIKIDFTYTANTLREIVLPHTLIHGRAPGKAQIGISIVTTSPANLILHTILPFAGESTQIWPAQTLGKEYIVPSWGPANDIDEQNHAEIAISPVNNETAVTITPSATTIDGIKKDTTYTILLNVGDSYILKADTSSLKNGGLSGTHIKASGPISVMTALTCGYVPQGVQACNMLLDHVLPIEYMDVEFFASPLGDTVRAAFLVFTSTQKEYFIRVSDGRFIPVFNGTATVQIQRPVRCVTSAPALCDLLTPGVNEALVSDPSLVTILPTRYYQQTLLWNTPNITNEGIPFFHTVNVITPTSGLTSITIDDKQITSLASSAVIAGTDHSVVQVVLQPGPHSLRSSDSVFAVASGFYTADAYSFLPMGSRAPSKVKDQPEYDLPLTVRPNPADKTLSVDLVSPDSNIELIIFNALGNVVLRLAAYPTDLHTIDIGVLPPGSYTLEVLAGTHRGRSRFVISR